MRDLDFAIILEDDVDLSRHIKSTIEKEFKERMKSNLSNWPDILLIGHCWPEPSPSQETTVLRTVNSFTCTHAYGLSKRGAMKLVKASEREGMVQKPVDNFMSDVLQRNEMSGLGFFPPLARQLPRSYLRDSGVSGSGEELPFNVIDDPVLLSNEDQIMFISNHTRFKS